VKSARFDWWKLFHRLMTELPWATPEAIGRLTLTQALCLGSDRAPGDTRIDSREKAEAYIERRRRAEAEWGL
jgi:hypothetical protein